MKIPKRISFVWIGRPMPAWVAANIERWRRMNPDYTITVHGTEVLRPEWEDCYRRTEDFCTRSDILRLSVLREQGGWYLDTDFIPLQPMSALADKYKLDSGCFLTKQWDSGIKRIANGVIGIAKGSPVWDEVDIAIAESRSAPIERCTYGPLLATRLTQRCPEIEIAEIKDFYLWRFSPSDEVGVNEAMRKYETLLSGNFDEASIEATCGIERPLVVHLWLGGKYDWEPNRPRLPGRLGPAVPKGGACSACQGRGCKQCNGSGMACDQAQTTPPREELEAWADSYSWRVSCFENEKIVLLRKP